MYRLTTKRKRTEENDYESFFETDNQVCSCVTLCYSL